MPTGDGPLVKVSRLIFLAQSLLVPTLRNDTGVNRAPGTIFIGVERQESPGGVAAAGLICPWRGAAPADSCLKSRGWVRALHAVLVCLQPRRGFSLKGPHCSGRCVCVCVCLRCMDVRGSSMAGSLRAGMRSLCGLADDGWLRLLGWKGATLDHMGADRMDGHPGATASERGFPRDEHKVLRLGSGHWFLSSRCRGTD